jgi:hypothetical protein
LLLLVFLGTVLQLLLGAFLLLVDSLASDEEGLGCLLLVDRFLRANDLPLDFLVK